MISLIFKWILTWLYEKPVFLVQSMMNFMVMCAVRFKERKHAQMPAIEDTNDPKFRGVRGVIRAVNRLVRFLIVMTYQRVVLALLYAMGGMLLIFMSFVILIGAFAIWGLFVLVAYGFIWEAVELWRWVASKI